MDRVASIGVLAAVERTAAPRYADLGSRAGSRGSTTQAPATPEVVSVSSVLFLCTGNLYRSVSAAAMLATRIPAGERRYAIRSAGLTPGGQEWPGRVRRVLRRHGIALPEGQSRQVSPSDVDGALLILGMELLHLRAVEAHFPGALARSFLLRDVVERSRRLGGRPAHVPLRRWIADLDADRRHDQVVDGDLEIRDPERMSTGDLRQVLSVIDDAVDGLVTYVLAPGANGVRP